MLCCIVLYHVAMHYTILTLQSVTLCCNVLHYVVMCYTMLQCCYTMLQCVTLCCNVLHYVALCYAMLQCVIICLTLLLILTCPAKVQVHSSVEERLSETYLHRVRQVCCRKIRCITTLTPTLSIVSICFSLFVANIVFLFICAGGGGGEYRYKILDKEFHVFWRMPVYAFTMASEHTGGFL